MSRLRQIYTELHERICRESVSEEVYTALAVLIEVLVQQEERLDLLERLVAQLQLPTTITFQETSMNPTAANSTQVFTGTLAPAGSQFPSDAAFTIASNDTAVSPSVDSTGLVVSVTYPDGWTENTTTPLAFTYGVTSASNAGWTLGATITPSAPPVGLPESITFKQTT